jgi:hypothetical protein
VVSDTAIITEFLTEGSGTFVIVPEEVTANRTPNSINRDLSKTSWVVLETYFIVVTSGLITSSWFGVRNLHIIITAMRSIPSYRIETLNFLSDGITGPTPVSELSFITVESTSIKWFSWTTFSNIKGVSLKGLSGVISVTVVVTKHFTDSCSTIIVVPEVVTTEWVPLSVLPDLNKTSWVVGKSDIIVATFSGNWWFGFWGSSIMGTNSWASEASDWL